MEKVLVFDPEIDAWLDNRIFNPEFACNYPGAMHWAELAKRASLEGIRCETMDRFLARKPSTEISACLMIMATRISPEARKVISERKAFPGICVCQEPPLVAFDFYHNLKRYSALFKHVFAFAGASGRVISGETKFHPIVWPYERNSVISGPRWEEREYLCLINRNGRAAQAIKPVFKWQHPRTSFQVLTKYYWLKFILGQDNWFGKELYLERLEAIHYFSTNPGFHLYGRGWNWPVPGVLPRYNHAVHLSYRGEIPSQKKLSVMSQYRFGICFENSKFPGYITEKILDAFCSGCIPVYLGAPDVDHFIPANAFIDFRNFHSYTELDQYLSQMTTLEASRYLQAVQDFLVSPEFMPFTSNNLVEKLMESVNDCFGALS
jgi:hypothetical protein